MRALWTMLYIVLAVPMWFTGILALHKVNDTAAESIAVVTVIALAFSLNFKNNG